MDAKTARKYRRLGRVPSELEPSADVGALGRIRSQSVWDEIRRAAGRQRGA